MADFVNGSWTSEVASKMAERLRPRVREEILDYLGDCEVEGATDQELELALNRPGNTIRPGRVALVREGLVAPAGNRWRPTQSNRPAQVWVLSRFAADAE